MFLGQQDYRSPSSALSHQLFWLGGFPYQKLNKAGKRNQKSGTNLSDSKLSNLEDPQHPNLMAPAPLEFFWDRKLPAGWKPKGGQTRWRKPDPLVFPSLFFSGFGVQGLKPFFVFVFFGFNEKTHINTWFLIVSRSQSLKPDMFKLAFGTTESGLKPQSSANDPMTSARMLAP